MPTYTYRESGARTTPDLARELLGDNATTPGTTTIPAEDALLSDEHIAAILSERGGLALAVAWLADELVTRYAQEPGSVTLPNGLSVTWRERVDAWTQLAARMRAQGIAPTDGDPAARSARIGTIAAGTDFGVR